MQHFHGKGQCQQVDLVSHPQTLVVASNPANSEASQKHLTTLKGLVLSSVANLVHLRGEDVGSNPAWTILVAE